VWAVLREFGQRFCDLFDGYRIQPQHLDTQPFQLINLTFRIAAAPGEDDVGF
jgi:hypothetical protein